MNADRPLHPAAACSLLLLPALLLAVVDFACRMQLATLLELQNHPDTRALAPHAAAIGVGKDLVFVLPAYAMYALTPGVATRHLTHVVFALALIILAGDVVYFYQTFEHVEPVLFVNLNWYSIRGTLSLQVLLFVLAGAAVLFCLARLNGCILRATHARTSSAWVPALVAGASLCIGAPALVAADQTVPPHPDSLQHFLNKTRDAYLAKVSDPIVGNLFASIARSRDLEKVSDRPTFVDYTAEERAILDTIGLLDADAPEREAPAATNPEIRRIAMLIFESVPAGYMHFYNPTVPAESTAFLDELLGTQTRFDRFYTSNMPTAWGLNSLLLSRLRPDWAGGRPTLMSVLRDELGFESHYIRGGYKNYGNQLEFYSRMFQMDHYSAFEDLEKRYDAPWRSKWGMNNAVVYDDGIRILREGRDKNVFVALKTIDLHQPGSFEGIPRKYLPQALQDRGETIFNALYWMDHCVRMFFEKLEKEQLFDEHTLVIITSDHAPHPGVGYRSIVPPHEYHRLGRLPLIFITRDPGALPEMATNGITSQVDVSPTILSLLGIAKPRGWVGRSLVGRDQPRIGLGVYRDRFYYGSDRGSFIEELGEGAEESPRNRAIRKWLSNLDVDGDREFKRASYQVR